MESKSRSQAPNCRTGNSVPCLIGGQGCPLVVAHMILLNVPRDYMIQLAGLILLFLECWHDLFCWRHWFCCHRDWFCCHRNCNIWMSYFCVFVHLLLACSSFGDVSDPVKRRKCNNRGNSLRGSSYQQVVSKTCVELTSESGRYHQRRCAPWYGRLHWHCHVCQERAIRAALSIKFDKGISTYMYTHTQKMIGR